MRRSISAITFVPPSKKGKIKISARMIEAADNFKRMSHSVYQKFGKRYLDLTLGTVLVHFFWPALIIIGLLIKISSKGPILFKQKRVGRNGKVFIIYKFRTMIDGAEKIQGKYKQLNEADGPVFKIRDDPRYTKFGKFLSHTGLDELPQIFNILRGDMSFVGPRPLPVEEEKDVSKSWRGQRKSVRPGIISSWLQNGGHQLTFKQWMFLDLRDIVKSGFLFDLNLIFATVLLMGKFIAHELAND